MQQQDPSDAARTSAHTGITPAVTVDCITLGPFETNCFIVREAAADQSCWIVDAGFEPAELIERVRSMGARPEALMLTHAHVDHIAGVNEVLRAFPGTPVLVHAAEREWLADPVKNLSAMMGMPITAQGPHGALSDGQTMHLGNSHWRVLHTPGHSPGGITLHCEAAGIALVGDTLFAGSIGRTDFPGCDFATLERSIREHLYTLPLETRVYPGHGPATTIARERASNPFVRAR